MSNQNWAMGLKRMYHTWTSNFLSLGWSPLGSPCFHCVCCRLLLSFSEPRLMRGNEQEEAFGDPLLFEDIGCVWGRGGKSFASLCESYSTPGWWGKKELQFPQQPCLVYTPKGKGKG